MQTLSQALYEFLVSTDPGGLSADRFNARQVLQNAVKDEVYLARRRQIPCGSNPYALVYRRLSGSPPPDVWGSPGHAYATVEFIILGKQNPSYVEELAHEQLRVLLSAYRGPMDEIMIYDSEVIRMFMPPPLPPIDASDYWQFQGRLDVTFLYQQKPVPFGV